MASDREGVFSNVTTDDRPASLEMDSKGNLYWNGKQVVTKQKITLSLWVSAAVIVGAASTVVLAVVAVIDSMK